MKKKKESKHCFETVEGLHGYARVMVSISGFPANDVASLDQRLDVLWSELIDCNTDDDYEANIEKVNKLIRYVEYRMNGYR